MNTAATDADRTDRQTLDWTTRQQGLASDPLRSAWVSANAGSGKTHVLSQRVIRLLLAGFRPSAILCLTYTKAAASEMANRVFDRLAKWTRLDDGQLSNELAELDGKRPDAERIAFARQLFARALETPGGLKIQTIHAFCEAVLHQFPLEANVAGHFEVMDDTATARLLAEARQALLETVAQRSDEALVEAFETVLEQAGEWGLDALLGEILQKRQAIRRFLQTADGHGGVDSLLRRALQLDPQENAETIVRSVWPLPPGLDLTAFVAAAVGQKAKTPRNWAEKLSVIAGTIDPFERYDLLKAAFLKQDGQPRSLRNAVTQAMRDTLPDAEDQLVRVSAHICAAHDRLQTLKMIAQTDAALFLARRLDRDYERLKRRQGKLDFDDLVARTASLLEREGAGPWVHYKLDRGIDHILVDEAQDTSPDQWSVIEKLADEFFSGESARDLYRTLFAVGDEKQSIYSFQGARPELFMQMGRTMRQRAFHAQKRFEPLNLHLSFRSTPDVLAAVDTVFSMAEHRRGLNSDDEPISHAAFRAREPGRVDVWEMIGKQRTDDHEDWKAPFDATPENAPPAILARRVAGTVASWLSSDETIVHNGMRRPVSAGDILILVRKRDGFVGALMRQLKRAGIPVAGADRLKLTQHIAIEDLTALGRFVLMPADDLSLCAVLKSPLFDFDEDDIFCLAAQRTPEESVFARLSALAVGEGGKWAEAHTILVDLLALADRVPVHDFFARLLGPGGGRAKFLARLGSEASDILDEFLAFALDQEQTGLPGLEGFLSTLEEQSPEIKRELQQGRDEIRIMTVHAAKGLEAPIVFLVDSGGKAAEAAHLPKLQELPVDKTVGALPPALLWVAGKSSENATTKGLKKGLLDRSEEEYRRLLYVGMTRAADRLVLCGYHGLTEPAYFHWHKMVAETLGNSANCAPAEFKAGDQQWSGFRFLVSSPDARQPVEEPSESASAARPLPDALTRSLRAPTQLPRPLAPSAAGLTIDPDLGPLSSRSPLFDGPSAGNRSMERGRIVHRLLQLLPDLRADQRRRAAERYADRALASWPAKDRAGIVDAVLGVLDDAAFAPVFASGSRAEVSVMGTLIIDGEQRALSARLDRVAVTNDQVFVVDYKTNRAPPVTVSDVQGAYITQMALYRALLQPLYPEKSVETALLFTETPSLITIPPDDLTAALLDLTTK
ncbi:MAG: double-strand break repair helicase AddA [Alphaproteobacteria bacterium]|nr:double-strand break repair helicase AddA [Alphaproteobacteria bacterium]